MPSAIKLPEQNLVLLVGRLTRDPNVAFTQKGQAVCRCDIAVNRRRAFDLAAQIQGGAALAGFPIQHGEQAIAIGLDDPGFPGFIINGHGRGNGFLSKAQQFG